MSANVAPLKTPKRAYQACVRCRQRKARCIVDPEAVAVDSDIACLRCKRERKVCYFSAERSQKRSDYSSEQIYQGLLPLGFDDSSVPVIDDTPEHILHPGSASVPLPPFAHTVTQPPETIHSPIRPPSAPTEYQPTSNNLTEQVACTTVSNQAEGLDLLFEAAHGFHSRNEIASTEHSNRHSQHGTPARSPGPPHDVQRSCQSFPSWASSTYSMSDPSEEALKIWRKAIFVKKRWLTAREAITYVDLFYHNMMPLTPIIDDYYANHCNFAEFIKNEPILCATILTLSTRYHFLNQDNQLSRGYFLHNRFWLYSQSLIQRVVWGQEKRVTNKTRSLGTIEALLLMTEWHNRSLHLPPNIDAWGSDDDIDSGKEAGQEQPQDQGEIHITSYPELLTDELLAHNTWLEGVVEPMKRSDRMSWFLLQSAANLAEELGVFEDFSGNKLNETNGRESPHQLGRKQRLGMLLYVYTNQLGCRVGSLHMVPRVLANPPVGVNTADDLQIDPRWFDIMSLYVELTRIARSSSDFLFSSKTITRQLVHSGSYSKVLATFTFPFEKWWEKYSSVPGPETMKALLSIDCRYIKVSIYSLVLQAVAERKEAASAGETTGRFLSSLLYLQPGDYEIMQDIVKDCKEILTTILSFSENGKLKYLPVRTYARTITACIYLLKTVALGVREEELNISLDLIDRSAHALRVHIVDDLHLAGIFASLLERYTKSFRETFFRIAKLPPRHDREELQRPSYTSANFILNQDNGDNPGTSSNTLDSVGMAGSSPASFAINDLDYMTGDWLTYPFDTSLAPFGLGITQGTCPSDEELNFIWNHV